MGLSRDIVSVIDPYSCKFCSIKLKWIFMKWHEGVGWIDVRDRWGGCFECGNEVRFP